MLLESWWAYAMAAALTILDAKKETMPVRMMMTAVGRTPAAALSVITRKGKED